MNWLFPAISWYIVLLVLGVVFFPVTAYFFGKRFVDYGYGFAKTIGILVLTYSMFVLGTTHILPFSQYALLGLLVLFAFANGFLYFKHHKKMKEKNTSFFHFVVFEEILFFVSFLFWIFIRGQEPSIRGLEKFMDFGFMNSILKSTYFPPLDMWLSSDAIKPQGYAINYYYFGHLVGALLIKISGVVSSIGYNLILASIFALSVTQAFSITISIVAQYREKLKQKGKELVHFSKLVLFGLLGAFTVSLAGNLHTIYLFTKGYPNENPVPFWNILSWYNPGAYWYPNATRFIPFTIHEFPSYSWVVADLHGHVFDIPFVLLTLAIIFILFISMKNLRQVTSPFRSFSFLIYPILLGFLCAVHYMTNAFDGLIYLFMASIAFLLVYRLKPLFFISLGIMGGAFFVTSLPFSLFFKPFVSGVGVNCSPSFLVKLQKIGPFLFEKGNCQVSPLWMLLILWGFFIITFVLFLCVKYREKLTSIDLYIFLLYGCGIGLLVVPEFFYIKDIYPAHFRANTMFKLGYQAFIMMSIASTYTFFRIKTLQNPKKLVLTIFFLIPFLFIALYPLYSIPSYYGKLNKPIELDGSLWMKQDFPQDKEIVDYINKNIPTQMVILEAQGDSYTDFNKISAYTGMPTVAGWWVHEWLWRGSSDIVGLRIPDIVSIYESRDLALTKSLLSKYNVSYVIVSSPEKEKYPNLNESKFNILGKRIFTSSNGVGALYQIEKK